jgi:hypothetical protein
MDVRLVFKRETKEIKGKVERKSNINCARRKSMKRTTAIRRVRTRFFFDFPLQAGMASSTHG